MRVRAKLTLSLPRVTRPSVVIGDSGAADYPVALEIPRAAAPGEHLRQFMIRFVANDFRVDVKKAVGAASARVELKWDEGVRGGRVSYANPTSVWGLPLESAGKERGVRQA